MKKILFLFLFLLQFILTSWCQQITEEFNIYDGENIFHLNMSINDIHRILGTPYETQITKHIRHDYNIITLKYPGIEFLYFNIPNFENVIAIEITEIGINYKLNKKNIIGYKRENIINEYGDPHFIEETEHFNYFYYEFYIRPAVYYELKFRFNYNGNCDQIIITHSSYYI